MSIARGIKRHKGVSIHGVRLRTRKGNGTAVEALVPSLSGQTRTTSRGRGLALIGGVFDNLLVRKQSE